MSQEIIIESSYMKWYIYKTLSVDAFWNNLRSVAETERQIGRSQSVSLIVADAPQEKADALAFLEGWTAAKAAICAQGWNGLERSDAVVFWLPSNTEFLYGFVVKPASDYASAFIASPYALPWLHFL